MREENSEKLCKWLQNSAFKGLFFSVFAFYAQLEEIYYTKVKHKAIFHSASSLAWHQPMWNNAKKFMSNIKTKYN